MIGFADHGRDVVHHGHARVGCVGASSADADDVHVERKCEAGDLGTDATHAEDHDGGAPQGSDPEVRSGPIGRWLVEEDVGESLGCGEHLGENPLTDQFAADAA